MPSNMPSLGDILTEAKIIIQAAIDASSGALHTVKRLEKGGKIFPGTEFPTIWLVADTDDEQHQTATGGSGADKGYGGRFGWRIVLTAKPPQTTESNAHEQAFMDCDAIFKELRTTLRTNVGWNDTVHDTNRDSPAVYNDSPFGDIDGFAYTITINLLSNFHWGNPR